MLYTIKRIAISVTYLSTAIGNNLGVYFWYLTKNYDSPSEKSLINAKRI